MTAKEILENYPKAADAAGEYFYGKLVSSLVDADVSEEYKDFIKSQEFNNEFIANVIDSNPRAYFDVFDSNDIYIEILVDHTKADVEFAASVIDGDIYACPGNYKHRIEAEKVAVEKAFQILNDKL